MNIASEEKNKKLRITNISISIVPIQKGWILLPK